MRGRLFLNYFIHAVVSESKSYFIPAVVSESKSEKFSEVEEWRDTAWTEFMQSVMDRVAEVMNCHVARIRPENEDESGEYLKIDAMFIDKAEYIPGKKYDKYDPFVLPRAVVELENNYDPEKISYCLWKILCVRAPIRVLIGYQKGADKIVTLKQYLEDVIWQGGLMKGSDGDLLVIIGDETREKRPWGEYFSVFEWRNDRLVKVEGLEWKKEHSP